MSRREEKWSFAKDSLYTDFCVRCHKHQMIEFIHKIKHTKSHTQEHTHTYLDLKKKGRIILVIKWVKKS